MSLMKEILRSLGNTSLSYKGVRVNMFGIPKFKNIRDGNLRSTLSYMKDRGLVSQDSCGWYATPAGKRYMRRKADSLLNFDFKFPKEAAKNLLVMFDIPETQKAEREWFRWHLKKFNYEMVQKSVWVGPSPLPKEFLEYLKKIKLKDKVKTFKLAKSYELYKNK